MTVRFEPAVEVVLRHEGGLVDHPKDPGGITKYGISLRYAQTLGLKVDIDGDGDVDADDIRKLSREKAIEIYRTEWWEKFLIAERFPDQRWATKVFDLAVNMGWKQVVKLVQRAVGVEDDGLFGPVTQVAVLKALYTLGPDPFYDFLREAERFYKSLAAQNPEQFQWALKGWLNRVYDI